MTNLFLLAALWSPCTFWGYYIASTDGRTSLGDASTFEWIVFWILAIAPYIVLTKIQPKNSSASESKKNVSSEFPESTIDNFYWSKAINEFESTARDRGLYAKLYSQYSGDEIRIKAEYLRLRSKTINDRNTKETEEKKLRQDEETRKANLNTPIEDMLSSGIFKEKYIHGERILIFPNGQAALKFGPDKYYLYKNYSAATESIEKPWLKFHDGFLGLLEPNSKNKAKDGLKIIKCNKCDQKIRIKNISGWIICPKCSRKWLHELSV
jgi:hypothetical protein